MKHHGEGKAGMGERAYRIAELVAASGVSRDMIKYYLRANLLPTPQKPRANLSLYSENHLELIRLIQRFQAQTKLSLDEIAGVFCAAGHDANAIEIELFSQRHSVGSQDNIIPLKTDTRNTRGLTFPADFLQQLLDAALLPRIDNLSENEEQLASLLWSAHQAGVPLEFFQRARQKLVELAGLEVKTLVAIKRPGLNYTAMVDNVIDVDRIINRWMITEKNSEIRGQFQRVIDNSERAISTLLDTLYQPSAVFRQRYGVEVLLEQLGTRLEAGPGVVEQSHNLCLACLLLTEYNQTIAIAEAILADAPDDAVARACISLAHGMQGNVDEAFDYGSQLAGADINHPVILQARMLALLLQAGKLGGVADTTELMKSAGELFLQMPADLVNDHPEAILSLARANVAFPDFANSRPLAIAALQRLQQQLEDNTAGLPALPLAGLLQAIQVTYRIYVSYYLGLLHHAGGDDANARRCFEQVIQLDPASNFGESAYLKLG